MKSRPGAFRQWFRRRLTLGLLLSAALLALPGCFTDKQNQGQRLYAQHCSGCHGEQGQGLGRLIPPIAGADYLARHRAELPCLLRLGQHGPIKVNGVLYNQVMPGHAELSPARLTNLLNYVENSWGNQATPRTIREVEDQLRSCGEAR
ncbi:c-type cytochrome [uncultured Hymenobacter sp.]|uniref:c-type cytochrome n=1 Tax=uncultured Hymenobacter sp. TaxID=170016 RepID=UPI0035CADD6F